MPNLEDVLAEHNKIKLIRCATPDEYCVWATTCDFAKAFNPADESLLIPTMNKLKEAENACEYFKPFHLLSEDCSPDCKRCGQDALLAWQRENCKLTRTKEKNPYLTKEFSTVKNTVASVAGSQGFDRGIQSQLTQDQQTINKILGVE